ncbi:MAG: hypothetical protein K9N06_12150 [Candidatus Cloacimonetes bacterium]|nr:hypothetical protein [Candidatus Cloacimonadota bacterium]
MKFPWYIWIPRVLIILVSLFAALFSIDVLQGPESIAHKLLGLLIHNIPVILILLILILTWKHPLIAGIVFSSLTLIFIILLAIYFKHFFLIDMIFFIMPLLISICLFFISHIKSIKNESPGSASAEKSEEKT